MLSTADSICVDSVCLEPVCASSALRESRLESSPVWIPDSLVEDDSLQISPRAVAWGAFLSLILWSGFLLAGLALLRAWR
jgi:hypothetical protein